MLPRIFFLIAAVLALAAPASRAQTAAEPADLAALHEKLARLDCPLTWVITGDSITQGAKWLGRERAYPELIQERVRWELQRRRDFFVNSGISGEKAAGLLADFEWRVLRFHPDIVSLMIGMNDAVAGPAGREKFEANLREMLRLIRSTGAIPVLHCTNPIDLDQTAARSRADLPAYNEIIARVAHSTGTILIDHWTHWQAAKPAPAALRDWLADPIHPNGAGHRQLAIEFFRTIGRYDPTAISCQP